MYTKDIELDGAPRHLEIDDTAGQEAYADLRNEKLGTGDGYILVYAINDDTTFDVDVDDIEVPTERGVSQDKVRMLGLDERKWWQQSEPKLKLNDRCDVCVQGLCIELQ